MIDDIDPDEAGGRSHRRWWIAAGAGVAMLAAGSFWLAVGSGGSTTGEVTATVPDSAPPPTDAPVPTVATTVPGFPNSGSDYMGDQLRVIARRTTANGIALTLYKMGDFEPDGIPQAQPGVTTGWAPAPWCFPSGSYRLTSSLGSSISVSNGPLYAAGTEVRAILHGAGQADGTPYRVLLVQVPAGVTGVTVRFGDGATDTTKVSDDGMAVLGTPGAFHGRFTLTLSRGTTQQMIDWSQIITEGSIRWQRACNPPPPGLPVPGPQQPAQPDAERLAIREQFSRLFESKLPFAERATALDDITGVEAAIETVSNGPYAGAVGSAAYQLGDVVFESPTRAWFQYSIAANGSVFAGRFGEANLIDGVWRISRATICQDLSLAGGACQPFVDAVNPNPVTPPVWGDT